MSDLRVIYVYDTGSDRYLLIRGNLSPWLRSHSIPAYRDRRERGYWLWRDRLPDLLAAADHDGVTVREKHRRAA